MGDNPEFIILEPKPQAGLAHFIAKLSVIELTSGTNESFDKILKKQRNSYDLIRLQQEVQMILKALRAFWWIKNLCYLFVRLGENQPRVSPEWRKFFKNKYKNIITCVLYREVSDVGPMVGEKSFLNKLWKTFYFGIIESISVLKGLMMVRLSICC